LIRHRPASCCQAANDGRRGAVTARGMNDKERRHGDPAGICGSALPSRRLFMGDRIATTSRRPNNAGCDNCDNADCDSDLSRRGPAAESPGRTGEQKKRACAILTCRSTSCGAPNPRCSRNSDSACQTRGREIMAQLSRKPVDHRRRHNATQAQLHTVAPGEHAMQSLHLAPPSRSSCLAVTHSAASSGPLACTPPRVGQQNPGMVLPNTQLNKKPA
jgi:hypothetical protein